MNEGECQRGIGLSGQGAEEGRIIFIAQIRAMSLLLANLSSTLTGNRLRATKAMIFPISGLILMSIIKYC